MSDQVISTELLTELSNDEQEILTGGHRYGGRGYGYGPGYGRGYGRGYGWKPHRRHYGGYGGW